MKLVPLPLPNFYKKQEKAKRMSSKRKKTEKKGEKSSEVVTEEVESVEEMGEPAVMEPLPKSKMRSFNSVATLGKIKL